MNSLPLNARGAANQYLQSLRALASEISNAMSAIAENSPERIQASVSLQEMLCTEATAMAHALMELARADASQFDTTTRREIREMQAYVGDLLMRYRALLHHSGKTIAVLSNLCTSYGGGVSGSGYTGVTRRTWSCEV